MEPRSHCSTHVCTEFVTRNQQVLCLLTNITLLHTVPGQRSKTVSVHDDKTRPNFIMAITQTATPTVRQQSPQSQNQDLHTQPSWKQTRTPQAPNKWQAASGWAASHDRHRVLLAHQGTSLETWFTEAKVSNFLKIHRREANVQGAESRAAAGTVSRQRPAAQGSLRVFIWGRTQL